MATIIIDARKIKSTTGRYVLELVRNLEELDRRHHYKILVYASELDYYKPSHDNFEVIAADFPHYSFAEQLGFARFLRALKPDLVHFYMPQQPLLYAGKVVTTVHDLNLLRIQANDMGPFELVIKKMIFAGLLRAVARRSARIITPTQYTKDDLVRFAHIPPQKVTVTLEGVPQVHTPTPMPAYAHAQFIVYLGRAEPYKNNRTLIRAHQALLSEFPKLRLVIGGGIDSLRTADMQWVKGNGYKNIDFVGYISDEQAAWLYQRCQAFVLPSLMEGFGLPALEAMAQGAPVVSTNTTCSPEVYGSAAHYFDPHSAADMTRAIRDVLTNKSLQKELSKKGKQQVKKYSWQRMASQTLAIYNEILAETVITD